MKKTKVAVVPAEGFGDGLVQLVIANNLQKLGYDITYYNNYAKALENSINAYKVKNSLQLDCNSEEFEPYHVVLFDAHSKFARGAEPQVKQWLHENAVPYIMSGSRMELQAPNKERLRQRLGDGRDHLADFFVQFYKRPRFPKRLPPRLPVVQQVKRFFRYKLNMDNATDQTGVRLKFFTESTKNSKRVVIHPTSSNENKNWRKDQYLLFANMLKKAGWEPVFTVAPNEREEWLKLTDGAFEVPSFPSIEELAKFYAASYAFVGNDSGNAHLASMLGLPCLVIFKRWRRHPGWRPGWGNTKVVLADFPYLLKKRGWQKGVKVEKVLFAFQEMIKQ